MYNNPIFLYISCVILINFITMELYQELKDSLVIKDKHTFIMHPYCVTVYQDTKENNQAYNRCYDISKAQIKSALAVKDWDRYFTFLPVHFQYEHLAKYKSEMSRQKYLEIECRVKKKIKSVEKHIAKLEKIYD